MDGNYLLLVKFGGETMVLNSSQIDTYDNFINSFSSNWPNADLQSISFYYEITGHAKCCLKTNVDMGNMVLLAQSIGIKLLNVSAVELKENAVYDSGMIVDDGIQMNSCLGTMSYSEGVPHPINCGTVVASREVVSADGCIGSDSESDEFIYDICPVNSKKVLLCDGWSSLITGVGQKFSSAEEYRTSLIKYSSQLGFEYKFIRNERERVNVVCSKKFSDGCKWFIKCSVSSVDGCFHIKSCNTVHSCSLSCSAVSTSRIGCRLLSEIVVENVRKKSQFSPVELIQLMHDYYGMEIKYGRARRAVEKARESVFGNFKESFQELGWYSDAIKKTNPGSHVEIEVDPTTKQFSRCFVSFGACIDGFKSCRPMLFLDGTFLKSRFRGTILSATSKDANNGLFPVAFAVVLAENKSNWIWFLAELKKVLTGNVIFITDRNVGLLEALASVFDGYYNFYCLQHLKNNLLDYLGTKDYSSKKRDRLCFLLSKMAKAPNLRIFEEYRRSFKDEGGSVCCSFLDEIPFEKWAISHSHTMRYGEMTSNAVESLNRCLLEARGLSVTHAVDCIRLKLMEWFVERRSLAENWNGILCHRYDLKWKKYLNVSASWNVKRSNVGKSIFEVFSNPSVTVDIGNKTCTCFCWQTKGFPCCHVAAVIRRSDIQLADIVDPYLTVSCYRRSYQASILPIPTTERFEVGGASTYGDIKPPNMNRLIGRPRKRRIKSKGEESRLITCGRCGRLGHHNKKSCREAVRN